MHGAVAWRARLLGWRGAYALDALGWHDRMRRHLDYWTAQQNTSPVVPGSLFKPDPGSNLSRSENAIHSNGDMSKNHYDMNLVFVDGLLRHLLWTGDVEFAKKVWPVIERHLGLGTPPVPASFRRRSASTLRGVQRHLGKRQPAIRRGRRHALERV